MSAVAEEQQEQAPQRGLFNPNEHMMQIRSGQTSKDYLPVQWRLVWFRSNFPHGTIETEMLHLDLDRDTEEEGFAWNAERRRSEKVIKQAKGFCVFHAIVRDGRGGVAHGTKTEKAASFGDFIEKAETGAIGRALAALGYGTQFCGDEWEENHRIVDSPVERPADTTTTSTTSTAAPTNLVSVRPANNAASKQRVAAPPPIDLATEQQISSIRKLGELLGKEASNNLAAMTADEAKALIRDLTAEYREQEQAARAEAKAAAKEAVKPVAEKALENVTSQLEPKKAEAVKAAMSTPPDVEIEEPQPLEIPTTLEEAKAFLSTLNKGLGPAGLYYMREERDKALTFPAKADDWTLEDFRKALLFTNEWTNHVYEATWHQEKPTELMLQALVTAKAKYGEPALKKYCGDMFDGLTDLALLSRYQLNLLLNDMSIPMPKKAAAKK